MESPPLLLDGPDDAPLTIVLAHGAGAPMDSTFMAAFAEELAAEGYRAARFEFPYMAKRRRTDTKKPPDRAHVLLDTWRAVIGELGGAGLVIIEVAAVHETAFFSSRTVKGYLDDCIPGYRRLAEAVHGHGCKVFGQLFHPGREVYGGVLDAEGGVDAAASAAARDAIRVGRLSQEAAE